MTGKNLIEFSGVLHFLLNRRLHVNERGKKGKGEGIELFDIAALP